MEQCQQIFREGIARGISWRFVGGAAPVGERGVSGQPGVAWTASARTDRWSRG